MLLRRLLQPNQATPNPRRLLNGVDGVVLRDDVTLQAAGDTPNPNPDPPTLTHFNLNSNPDPISG